MPSRRPRRRSRPTSARSASGFRATRAGSADAHRAWEAAICSTASPARIDNGSFPATDYIAYDSTVEFSADLHSPGMDGFGTVSLAIVQGGIELAFDVLLVDGRRASGRYDGPATYFDERE